MTATQTPSKTPGETSQKAPARACANWRRVALGASLALFIGFTAAALGGVLVSDFTDTQLATVETASSQTVTLSGAATNEDMLRTLSQQLSSTSDSEASSLNDLAPAAGAPLGTFAE